jgi:hypothetical protein
MTELRPLTHKERLTVDGFEKAQPGLGVIAERTIRNPNSGWAQIIEDTPESEIKPGVGTASNSFCYRHIGH